MGILIPEIFSILDEFKKNDISIKRNIKTKFIKHNDLISVSEFF